ncbi:sensor histidine kinase [Clostridium intestinale]|jgi:signal transduction histidine kinase|uniref:histidine kinase n=1 Tax=Clostridium intestinale TaxID=36845 RepID=A0A7D6VRP6_9CLOT|nr:sensor histidine kinase [Clostridium intestinale]QLY81467.1 sensor histidine kinase [Clostridium intestinale]
MSLGEFLYEKLYIILLNIFSAFTLAIFLKLLSIDNGPMIVIIIIWIMVLICTFLLEYFSLKNKYKEINKKLDALDQKYLICELLDKPESKLEKVYFNMLRQANKSMIEQVGKSRDIQVSYKEYIEEWIHEIKNPIAAIDLICKNYKTEESNRISKELLKINYLVEQALYYARSENVEKDYFIKEIRLFNAVEKAIVNNRIQILEKNIKLIIDDTEDMVYTDEKWLYYILEQIIVNAIKYSKKYNGEIHIYTKYSNGGIQLIIEDNGIGIAADELPRIFDKGFTGSKRDNRKATGLGLYLCKKLSEKLGIKIIAESEKDSYTKISLLFQKESFVSGCIK